MAAIWLFGRWVYPALEGMPPMQPPEPVDISSGDSSSDDDSARRAKRVCSNAEDLKPTIGASSTVEPTLSVKVEAVEPTLEPTLSVDLSPQGIMLRKAQQYQEYMKTIHVPTSRGSVILFKSWTGLGMSMKELYKQPLHYLTNLHLKQLDRMRLGAEDEDTPLDFIINPVKAETSIWLIEEFHRLTASPHQLAKLWLNDPVYHMFIDPVLPSSA